MNKLTKVGFSALCGSLAAISAANAGEMTVTGGADMTWISKEADTTGNPIGMGSNLTFKGSGELDNGWTFDLSVANLNGNAFSAAALDVVMGGLGTLSIDQGDSGNGISAYDDKMPTAWEEAWGAGLSTHVKLASGAGTAMNIGYASPTILGTTLKLAYAPAMGATDTADKGSAVGTAGSGRGYDALININPSLGTEILSGLNIYAGGHYTQKAKGNALEDLYSAVGGVTYDIGPLSLGIGAAGEATGQEVTASAVTAYKSNMFGIAFNVNDDLSISYSEYDTRKAGFVHSSGYTAPNTRKVEVESIQIAYTMGGASIRIAEIEATNVGFSSGANKDATVVSLGLAF